MSGIYIPGMEMPQRDEVITIYPDGPAHRHHLGLRLRISESKAIPVPEHGRLIDADALAHDLDDDVENDQRALDEMDFVGKERERVQFDKDCKQNCMWYLSEAPTIIPADKEGEG